MIVKGSDVRTADHPIDALFVDRWSPRAMSGEPIDEAELFALFEAARWAPSSGNSQPWRILYAHRDTEHWPRFFDLLVERNKIWCVQRRGARSSSSRRRRNEQTGRPLITHSYDTGAAWENLALQGWLSGSSCTAWPGSTTTARADELGVPEDFQVERDVRRSAARADRRSARSPSRRARRRARGRN